MKWYKLFFLLIVVSFSLSAFSQEEKLEIYDSPKKQHIEHPDYPKREVNTGKEGWVIVNYMVDTNGAVFEPSVVASAGSTSFEKEAIEAIKKSKFEPAKINGQPVEGSGYMKFTFSMHGGANGASRSFVSRYKRLNEELAADNEDAVASLINELEKRANNHYERAYLDFVHSVRAAGDENSYQQMMYLRSALQYESDYDDDKTFLPEDLVRSARQQLFALEVSNHLYADALDTYKIIKKKHGDEAIKPFEKAYDQILELKNNDVAYAVEGRTNEAGFFFVDLHKTGFGIIDADVAINEFKLRCQKKYVFFAYEEGKEYRIPKSWGDCNLQVLGEANGRFSLVQF